MLPLDDLAWAIPYGPVVLEPLTEEHLPPVVAACSDDHAKAMLRHAFRVDDEPEVVADHLNRVLLGPWAYKCTPFAVCVDDEVVGLRYVETARTYDDLR
jgi:hypothetical protein